MTPQKRSDKEPNFETALKKLEAIVKRLEEEEIPLETSLKLFAEGQALARACEERLREAENQIRELMETSGGQVAEKQFEPENEKSGAEADEGLTEQANDEDDKP